MIDAPEFTVVILNFGRPEGLSRALKALQYQRFRNFEVVVMTDLPETAWPKANAMVRMVPFLRANVAAGRNAGLRLARGRFIAYCDDDAVPEFAWLAELRRGFMDASVGAVGGFVYGRNGIEYQWKAIRFDQTGEDREIRLAPDGPPRAFAPVDDGGIKTVGTNCAFRCDALRAIGGFDEAYAYYLDETDVNLRLARAGWRIAIAPRAKVHHGFQSGLYRSGQRAPLSLFEIGASKAYFCRRHADPAALGPALALFESRQRKRLVRMVELGALDPFEVERLVTTLRAGFRAGQRRRPQLAADLRQMPPPAAPLPAPGVPARDRSMPAPRVVVLMGTRHRARLRRAAEHLASRGAEVSVLDYRYTTRRLSVRFEPAGYWLHRGGVFGLSDRKSRARLRLRRHAFIEEIRRISPDRRPQYVLHGATTGTLGLYGRALLAGLPGKGLAFRILEDWLEGRDRPAGGEAGQLIVHPVKD